MMNPRTLRGLALLAAASTLLLAEFAAAQATGGPSAKERAAPGASRPPAKEAVDACAGKAEGDKVTFKDAKGKTRKWYCTTVDGTLAARSGVAVPKFKEPAK